MMKPDVGISIRIETDVWRGLGGRTLETTLLPQQICEQIFVVARRCLIQTIVCTHDGGDISLPG